MAARQTNPPESATVHPAPVRPGEAPAPPAAEPVSEAQSILDEALAGGQKFAGARASSEPPSMVEGIPLLRDKPEFAGKQQGAADIHREVADKLREAAGREGSDLDADAAEELADKFDVFADAGDALAEVYRGDRSISELPAINAEMDATEADIEELAGELGMNEEAVDDVLGI